MIRELARRRVSSRDFKAEGVEFSAVTQVLKAARQAPSGANRQPWKFIVVNKPELKSRIREACEQGEKKYHKKAPQWMKQWMQRHEITPTKSFLTEAPYLIAVCSDTRAPYHIQST